MNVNYYVSVIPPALKQDYSIVSYEPRWYGRLLLRLADWLSDRAYIGAARKVDALKRYDGGYI